MNKLCRILKKTYDDPLMEEYNSLNREIVITFNKPVSESGHYMNTSKKDKEYLLHVKYIDGSEEIIHTAHYTTENGVFRHIAFEPISQDKKTYKITYDYTFTN